MLLIRPFPHLLLLLLSSGGGGDDNNDDDCQQNMTWETTMGVFDCIFPICYFFTLKETGLEGNKCDKG
jgi:hypothetical protein